MIVINLHTVFQMGKTKNPSHPASLANLNNWHTLSPENAIQRQNSDSVTGLSDEEVIRRSGVIGLNTLTPKKGKGPVMLFLSQLHQPQLQATLWQVSSVYEYRGPAV